MSTVARRSNTEQVWSDFEVLQTPPPNSTAGAGRFIIAWQTKPEEWLESVEISIHRMRDLPANWDSYGARRVHTASIEHAIAAARWLSRVVGVVKPVVTATNDGNVAFCWDAGDWSLDTEILPDGSFEYVYVHRRDSSRGQEDRVGDLIDVAGLLTKWPG